METDKHSEFRVIDGIRYPVRLIEEEPAERETVRRGPTRGAEKSTKNRSAHFAHLDNEHAKAKQPQQPGNELARETSLTNLVEETPEATSDYLQSSTVDTSQEPQ